MFRILIEIYGIKEVLSTVFKINKNIYKNIFFFFTYSHQIKREFFYYFDYFCIVTK